MDVYWSFVWNFWYFPLTCQMIFLLSCIIDFLSKSSAQSTVWAVYSYFLLTLMVTLHRKPFSFFPHLAQTYAPWKASFMSHFPVNTLQNTTTHLITFCSDNLLLFFYLYYTFFHVLIFFSFFFKFLFFFISWRLITLQYCSGFCHTLKWISHGFTCVPHPDPPSHLPLHRIPLGLPSAPGLSTCLMHPTWAGDLFHPR